MFIFFTELKPFIFLWGLEEEFCGFCGRSGVSVLVFNFCSSNYRAYFLTQKPFLAAGGKIEVWEDQRNIIKKLPINLFFLLSRG